MLGRKINNYEVTSLLGEGGMGSVYVAEHPVLNRRVAVKVLRREFTEDQSLVARFMNEARAASAIRQPNIIEIFDVGILSDGIPYLMMELLEGQSLAGRLFHDKRLAIDDAVPIAIQAATALGAAHAKQIVHRDLKPDNLFLVPDENAPRGVRVVVLDFGIAKLRGELATGSVKTHSGSVMGTPPYMSPEQCRGLTDEIDHRTDIYALGIILHEMLAGAPPFVSAGFGDLLVMHLTKAPPPLCTLDPTVPPHIEAIVLRALSKTREERFTSMGELKQALLAGPQRQATVQLPAANTEWTAAPDRSEASRPPVPRTLVGPRTTSTLSSTIGEQMSSEPTAKMDRSEPARGPRRAVAAVAAGIAVAAIAAAIFLFAARNPTPRESPSVASGPAAAVAPGFKPAPPAGPLPPAPPATPPPEAVPGAAAPAPQAEAEAETERETETGRKPDSDRPPAARAAKRSADVRPARPKTRPVAVGEPTHAPSAPARAPSASVAAPASPSPSPAAAPAPSKPRVSTDKW